MEFTGRLVVMDLAALVVNHANAMLVGLTEAFRVFGISLDREAVRGALGHSCESGAYRVFRDRFPHREVDMELLEAVSRTYRKEVHRYFKFSPALAPMPSSERALGFLRERGFRIGLLSDLEDDTVSMLLHRLGWDSGVFDAVQSGSGAQCKAERLTGLMDVMGAVRGDDAMYVGVAPCDMEAGRQANCALVMAMESTGRLFEREELALADGFMAYPDELVGGLLIRGEPTRHGRV